MLLVWNVKIYVTNNWKPYAEVIPKELLLQSKKQTHLYRKKQFSSKTLICSL